LTRIGFVGLGNMGMPMCENLVSGGFDVVAFDVRKEAVEAIVEKGASGALSAAEAANGADVLFTMLPGPTQVEAAMLGEDGALATMSPDSAWIDMSTSTPEAVDRFSAATGSEGPVMLDAPVNGGTTGAREGTLQIFVGGAPDAFERYRLILEVMGDPDLVVHVGGRGAGYAVKLCLNLLWYSHSAATAEVLTLGLRAGVELEALHRAITASAANSHFLEHDVLSVFSGDYDESFHLALVCKDLGLAVDLGRHTGTPLELSALVEQLHRRARAQYGDRGGQLAAARLLEDATRTSLRTSIGEAPISEEEGRA
jgi:3-hydroxyisobutyrate dehydrogenase